MRYDIEAVETTLYWDGITALRGAFKREWVARATEDLEKVGRGPDRDHVAIAPEALRGFVDLVTHPWVASICESVLGTSYQIVELGFDLPRADASEPWHRDIPSSAETYEQRRITSLAFDLTTVDTTPAMSAFEIAPGTQWERGDHFADDMYPPRETWHRYAAIAQPKLPRVGDLFVRSPLMIHRRTANHSELAQPVLVLRVASPSARHAAWHDPRVAPGYWASLPTQVRKHLVPTSA